MNRPKTKRSKPKRISRARLKAALLSHLSSIGVFENGNSNGFISKETIRNLHHSHRVQTAEAERDLIKRRGQILIQSFASGREVDVPRIEPYLVEVRSDTFEGDLFRTATLLWSVPVSKGFGRRMRFLVMDRQNDKLIGIVALGDPVFNLSCRDAWIGWDVRTREKRLVNVMDAYVLGAVPPYSQLIGGKLVAAMVASKEVNDTFERKYSASVGVISQTAKRPHLVLVTTTSALGRSSLYNRLKLPDMVEFKYLGTSKGYGHFQVPDQVFADMRKLLAAKGHKYAAGHQYGDGPNWRVRVIREALHQLGLPQDLLRHGIKREAYGVPLAENWKQYLCGEVESPKVCVCSSSSIGKACVDRWLLPRSLRDDSYRRWTREGTWEMLCSRFGED